jgi:polyisoprenoid-binding protein YceI
MARPAGAFLAALSIAGALTAQPEPTRWTIDTAASLLTVNVVPAGLLSSALHPHHFQPANWNGEISRGSDPGAVKVKVWIAADSLHDRQPKLSATDIEKIERRVRSPEVLDAARYPKIVFEASEFQAAELPAGDSGGFRGTLAGVLILHGKSHPLKAGIQGRLLDGSVEASGTVSFKQSDFGIAPYSTALGTVAVRDEVTIDFALVARIASY